MSQGRILCESLALALVLVAMGVFGAYACSAQQAAALYPDLRDHICNAGETLQDGPEKQRLRQLCAAEATVSECASAFEALAKPPTAK